MADYPHTLVDLDGDAHEIVYVEQWGIAIAMLAQAALWLPVVRDGSWEAEQRDYFFSQTRARGCSLGIDIGANNGIYTLLLCREPSVERVLAVEPCEPHFSMMRAALDLNGYTDRCETLRLACSHEAADKAIYVFPDATPSLNQLAETAIRSEEDLRRLCARRQTVRTAPLDNLLQATDRRIALKIDTEGHELSVIRGAERLLRCNRCFVQVECFGDEIARAMADLGYRLLRKIRHDWYFDNDND